MDSNDGTSDGHRRQRSVTGSRKVENLSAKGVQKECEPLSNVVSRKTWEGQWLVGPTGCGSREAVFE
jgi:hypothetical protein